MFIIRLFVSFNLAAIFSSDPERNLLGSESGYISSLIALASIPGALIFNRISRSVKETQIISFNSAAFSCFVPIYGNLFQIIYGPSIIALTCYSLTGKLALDPVLFAFVADHAPKNAYATAFGIFNFAGMVHLWWPLMLQT